MVMKGQFLERATLVPLPNGLVLEAVSHRGAGRPGVLIVPPVPAEGSGMDHVVGAELAFAVARAGHPCLRFNYRGVGASQGQPTSELAALLEDAQAAWELARDNADGAAPLLITLGGSDAVGRALLERVPVAAWLLVHPNLAAFDAKVPLAVVMPQGDPAERRRGWADALGDGLTVIAGSDRAYHRNLPQVGQAAVALLSRLAGTV